MIADDFTGASDIANTLAKGIPLEGGLRTALFSGVPSHPIDVGIEAGVVALKTRSEPVADAIADSLKALEWLQSQGARQIIFKYCSTFDSTPQGNIGPVTEALANALGADGVVICPAFPAAGRTVYQGNLFVFDRLLSESGMEKHPLTPMTDPDLRRWLSHQVTEAVGLIQYQTVALGAYEIAKALREQFASGNRYSIVDTLSERDLLAIGSAVADEKLVTGGSGIAIGLPHNFIAKNFAIGTAAQSPEITGPEIILVGSCSRATLGQIACHAENHPVLELDVESIICGTLLVERILEFAKEHAGQAPLVYSSGTPEEVSAVQQKYGREKASAALDAFFSDCARGLIEAGCRRMVVAGGETSGAVAKAVCTLLGTEALHIGKEIDPGVPLLVAEGRFRLAMALKSGNFGSREFFDKALKMMQANNA
ncbi:3-oxo-tetronate kinase [uncultured Cohaesibacter sp.]|uniref:3-oxo-tetronate kinase n=1 Tax=uncultured Cohaesibacter sp. TaxID=1002546 RepID=UPI0029C617D4|nr:3-oxo-tetronate kinase [uncultured Cohaesibacter sp.]